MLIIICITMMGSTTYGQRNYSREQQISGIMGRAQLHYNLGLAAKARNDFATMRAEFDQAIDELITSGFNMSADANLHNYYQQLVDSIVQNDLAGRVTAAPQVSEQRYELSPLRDVGRLTDIELAEIAAQAPAQPNIKPSEFTFKAESLKIEMPAPVNQFISYFTNGRGRRTLETGLMRAGRYQAMATTTFKNEGVPTDLIWLAQVESLWQSRAASAASARGLWQFIPATGARFGLRQDAWLDERLDPEKSTQAAARYLRFLADRYAGDWLLAMAAYNMGENGLDRAIERCGYADFWVLRERGYLPQETRNYVPAILAVIAIAHQPQAYGVTFTPEPEWQYEHVAVRGSHPLNTLATTLNVPTQTLLEWNPALFAGIVPDGYSLRVPKNTTLPSLEASQPSSYKTNNIVKKN